MCRYVFVRITEDNALTYTNPPCSLECWEEIQGEFRWRTYIRFYMLP
jgi:hypothetical protein